MDYFTLCDLLEVISVKTELFDALSDLDPKTACFYKKWVVLQDIYDRSSSTFQFPGRFPKIFWKRWGITMLIIYNEVAKHRKTFSCLFDKQIVLE